MRTEVSTHVGDAVLHDSLDVLIIFARRSKTIAAVTSFFLAVGVAVSYLVIRPSYTSVAIILPPKQFLNSAAMSPDLCVSILNSQIVDDKLIERLRLQSIWKLATLSGTRTALKSEVEVQATVFDAVRITVRDHDARRARDIAEGFVTELNTFDIYLFNSDASYRRTFFENEASIEKNVLVQAEDHLKDLQQQEAVIRPETQLAQVLQSITSLHKEIADREVALQSIRRYAADSNPKVIAQAAELTTLQRQLRLLEDDPSHRLPGDVEIPARQLAETVLQDRRALRDVAQQKTLLDFLTIQLAAARLNQVRSTSPVSAIDDAVVPDQKSGPQRIFIWAASCWVGFTSACLYIFLGQALLRAKQNPAHVEVLNKIGDAWNFHLSLCKEETNPCMGLIYPDR